MNDKKIETVRLLVKPGKDLQGAPNVTIPKTLNDPYLKKTVELNPDAEVSKIFAEAYVKTYEGYEIISANTTVDKSLYIINENYREPEIAAAVDNLTPVKKDIVFAFVKFMNTMPEAQAQAFKDNLEEALEDIKTYKADKEKFSNAGDKEKANDQGSGNVMDLNADKLKDLSPGKLKTFEECLMEKDVYNPSDIATETGKSPMEVGKLLTVMLQKGFVTKEGNVYKPTEQYKTILKESAAGGNQANNGGSD